MSKTILMVLIAISFVSTAAFAEPSIEVGVSSQNIKSLDSVFVIGTISGVSDYLPVTVTVTDPNGKVVYKIPVSIGNNGEFRELVKPTIPSFMAGTYTVTASHKDTEKTATTQFTVTAEKIPRNPNAPESNESIIGGETPSQPTTPSSGLTISADAINGSDVIKITGNTSVRGSDITLVVKSPSGNIITINQVSPGPQGNFNVDIKTGGPLWNEDGMYTITANQGAASEYKKTVKVEIKDGVVIPEFGVIASLVLVVSVFTIIIFSAKSKLSILPKY
ncbi:MAG: PEFG-CTERM sorting domain-containing protein [Nitrosopumilus sp.]|uniref:PEFG-CTERM sorting domain-containing protein n=1 Tax=Nitrosopumilus sp. TaxID=2024843 RepID=UPI00247DB35E|nr:PEFG-CTERM sorting domain-containing protein [Nitrosopumilus sp.]MCV0392516.1 PEFG-CTERM sorting domain-containing protein [Nitrosopumilus sp.]